MCHPMYLEHLEGIILMIDLIVIPLHVKLVSRETVHRQVQSLEEDRENAQGRARLAKLDP